MRRLDLRGGRVREYVYDPAVVSQPLGRVVFHGGWIGRHDGDGWVLVYGDGYCYEFVR